MSDAPQEMLNRFTGRVDNYVKYRPSYSREVVDFLKIKANLNSNSKVADVGSGTGIFSKILCEAGLNVFAVEPNQEMRSAAEKTLSSFSNFRSINGQAEKTTLESQDFDLIVAAQAFHWFDAELAKKEFIRILKPNGIVALVWNNRETESKFGSGYEHFLDVHSVDYPEIKASGERVEMGIASFFAKGKWSAEKFENFQDLDWDSLWGRFLSTSYSPKENHPKFEPAQKALRELFNKYQKDGIVRMVYNTEVFWGQLN